MKDFELKYGCNPNQKPAKIYMKDGSDLPIQILSGRPGYINFLDALGTFIVFQQKLYLSNLSRLRSTLKIIYIIH